MQNIIFFVVACFIILEEWFKFDYVCINFLNKMSGQIWCQKSQTIYNLERMKYEFVLPNSKRSCTFIVPYLINLIMKSVNIRVVKSQNHRINYFNQVIRGIHQ